MASFTTANMLATLYNRLMDPGKNQFDPNGNDDQLLLELNNAQEELINRLLPEFLTALEVKDELVSLDGNGEFDISDLSKVPIDGINSIQKILWYYKNASTGARTTVPINSLNEDQLNKMYNNGLFSGTNTEPKFSAQGSKVKIYAGVLNIMTAAVSEGATTVAPVSGEYFNNGGPLVNTDDYYNGFYLKAATTGNYYSISDYVGSTHRFTVSAIAAADANETQWSLYTPYKDNYCGSILVSYQRQPAEITATTDCELQNKYRTIILLLAESYVWASDGKAENSDRAYQKAMNQINMINGSIKPTDNIGYRAKKY